MDHRTRASRRLTDKLRVVFFAFLMVILIFASTGCRKEEKTPEPPTNAEASFNCDVRQGFATFSSPSEAEAIREEIKSIENQIKELQDLIATTQDIINSLQSTNKSEKILNLENNIKDLENQIKGLQEQIAALQKEIKALQATEKSEEVINLEKEIAGLQAQMASLRNNLAALQQKLDGSSYDGQSLVGFLEYLKIGDEEFFADLSVVEPISASGQSVVGVISSIYWQGGYADPIQFSCQISGANKNKIASIMHSLSGNTEVEFIFSIYDYDPQTKSYYKSFHTNSVALQGLVSKSGGEMMLNIDMEPSSEVTEPPNYSFALGVMPQDVSQEIQLAVSSNDRFSKKWGVEVGN